MNMTYYAPTPGAPIPRKFTTDNSLRVFFWVFATITLVGLFVATWCSSLPNSHNLGILVWPVTVVLVAVCTIVAFITAARSGTTIAVRTLIIATALAIVATFVLALTSDLVKLRWYTAESAFDQAAADAPPGSKEGDRWIAGYPVRKVWRDKHDNVYFTVDGTGLLCSDSGFAKLPAHAERSDTQYQYYIHLHDDWYYWLPETGMCEA